MARVPVRGDALLGAAGGALAVFILSGGVYAGIDGGARGAALVVGMLAVSLSAVLIVVYAWGARNRPGS